MKRETRALLIVGAALFGFFTAAAEARADSKEECAAAYEKTQALREGGKLRDARIQAELCSASTCSVYVTKDCLQWLREIDAIFPTVVFAAENGAAINILAVRVMVDGKPVNAKLDGDAVPLDPGEHIVRFEMAGAEAVEQKVMIQQGEKNRRLAFSFKSTPPPSPPVPPVAVLPPSAVPPSSKKLPAPVPLTDRVPLWIPISGSLAFITLAVSAGFGVSAVNNHSRLVTECGGDATRCPASTKAVTGPLAEQRDLDRNISIGFGAAAVVGIGVTLVGVIRMPPTPQASVALAPFASPSSGGLTLQGRF